MNFILFQLDRNTCRTRSILAIKTKLSVVFGAYRSIQSGKDIGDLGPGMTPGPVDVPVRTLGGKMLVCVATGVLTGVEPILTEHQDVVGPTGEDPGGLGRPL